MKTERAYPSVVIDARGTKKAQGGHPWVFDNEITQVNGTPEDGGLCDVLSPKGRYLGTGYYNSHSKIRVRMISQNANDTFGEAFFQRRVRYAWDYRKTVMGPEGTQNCRVIFGEADGFPGLTVDKFGDILVAQTLCLGTELRKGWIFQALAQALEAVSYTHLLLLFVKPWETEILAVGVQYLRIEGAFYWGIGGLFLLYGLYRAIPGRWMAR